MAYGRKLRPSVSSTRRSTSAVVQKRARKAKVSNLRLNPTVRALVDRRITRREQVKEGVLDPNLIYAKDGAIALADFKPLWPTVALGNERNDREGNKIRLKSFQIKGFMRFENIDNDSMHFVRLMVVSGKRGAAASQVWVDNMLLSGNTEHSFNGEPNRFYLPINHNLLTVHADRTYQVVQDKIVDATPLNANNESNIKVAIKPYLKQFVINLKVKNKLCRFAEEADTIPANFQPYLVIGTTNPRQTSADTENDCNYFFMTKVRWVNA